MPLTIEETRHGDVAVLRLGGRLDVGTSPQLEKRLQTLDGSIVIDLSALEYVSSAGLRTLLAGLDAFEKKQRGFALAGAHGYVREVFTVAGLDTVFAMHPDVDTALRG